MSYEALYSAVVGAAPTVLGFVLETRLSMKRARWKEFPLLLRIAMSIILISNGASALLSLSALSIGGGLNSSFYAGVVRIARTYRGVAAYNWDQWTHCD